MWSVSIIKKPCSIYLSANQASYGSYPRSNPWKWKWKVASFFTTPIQILIGLHSLFRPFQSEYNNPHPHLTKSYLIIAINVVNNLTTLQQHQHMMKQGLPKGDEASFRKSKRQLHRLDQCLHCLDVEKLGPIKYALRKDEPN